MGLGGCGAGQREGATDGRLSGCAWHRAGARDGRCRSQRIRTYDGENATDIDLTLCCLVPGSGDSLSRRGSVRMLYSLYSNEIRGVELLPDSIG